MMAASKLHFCTVPVFTTMVLSIIACRTSTAIEKKQVEPQPQPKVYKETFGSISTQNAEESVIGVIFPGRADQAASVDKILQETARQGIRGREKRFVEEISLGNVPDFLRKLHKFCYTSNLSSEVLQRNQMKPYEPKSIFSKASTTSSKAIPEVEVCVWALKDYIAIGENQNFVYIPLTLASALAIARKFNFVLPTRKLVDEIYLASPTKLTPIYMAPSPSMTKVSFFREHHEKIFKQMNYSYPEGIVSGHKKDVVLSRKLVENPGKLAIYGWHKKSGYPTQPLSIYHPDDYVDYSHGVRLVFDLVQVGGNYYTLNEVYSSREFNSVVSNEGPIFFNGNTRVAEE